MSRRYQRVQCPRATKKRYPTLEAARQAYEREAAAPGPYLPARWAYECRCKGWHRTSKNTTGSIYLESKPSILAEGLDTLK